MLPWTGSRLAVCESRMLLLCLSSKLDGIQALARFHRSDGNPYLLLFKPGLLWPEMREIGSESDLTVIKAVARGQTHLVLRTESVIDSDSTTADYFCGIRNRPQCRVRTKRWRVRATRQAERRTRQRSQIDPT